MDKNYYEWLEVNKNASNEVIEKAYKTLVKKYHPDLQEGQTKLDYEDILKHINEAYEVLSNPEKRDSYDRTLDKKSFSEEKYENLYKENQELKSELNHMNIKKETSDYQNNSNKTNDFDFEDYTKKANEAIKKAYYDAYIQDLRNRGYRIKYKKTFKDYLKLFITIIIVMIIITIIFVILWQIPPIRTYFINLYHNNIVFQFIVDFFNNLFNWF